ncbi:MAG: hypothetical protein ACJA2B_000813, partial [Candidatus Endobugula sp.]
MSYILESLKKSDQERHSASGMGSADVENLDDDKSHPFLDDNYSQNPLSEKNFRWSFVFLVVFVVGSILLLYLLGLYSGSSDEKVSKDGDIVIEKGIDSYRRSDPGQVGVSIPDKSFGDGKVGRKRDFPIIEENSEMDVSKLNSQIESVNLPEKNAKLKNKQRIARLYNGKIEAEKIVSEKENAKNESAEKITVDALYNVLYADGDVTKAPPEKIDTKVHKEKKEKIRQDIGESDSVIPSIFNLDRQFQKGIPAIIYGAHVYVSDNKSGFV